VMPSLYLRFGRSRRETAQADEQEHRSR
jgi:hypothetical protein